MLIFCFLVIFPLPTFADSQYILPYPSMMPGSIWYKIHSVQESLMKYWYFGDFGQFEYNLKEADKYLVEAKTLFEYNQYLLGYDALLKSDRFFRNTKPFLVRAQEDGKNISEKNTILKQAAQKHIQTLEKMKNGVPSTFTWSPEKGPATQLNLSTAINNSENERRLDL